MFWNTSLKKAHWNASELVVMFFRSLAISPLLIISDSLQHTWFAVLQVRTDNSFTAIVLMTEPVMVLVC